jgi:transcription elongation factor Elf1
MESSAASPEATGNSSRSDIVFACAHCATSFVVDAAASGVKLNCQTCGQPTTVPDSALGAATGSALKISELQHQLKENESQRTEITSYINQHSIQLHRWQLRLKSLNERQQKLEAELGSVCGPPAA